MIKTDPPPPPGQGVGSLGRGLYATVVIIDNDHGRRWGHRCHHRRSMVVVAGQSSSNQHRLWSSSSSAVVVVERVRSALTKHEDAHKHGGRGTANRRLDRILDRLLVHLFFEVEVVLANLIGVIPRGRAELGAGPQGPHSPRGASFAQAHCAGLLVELL